MLTPLLAFLVPTALGVGGSPYAFQTPGTVQGELRLPLVQIFESSRPPSAAELEVARLVTDIQFEAQKRDESKYAVKWKERAYFLVSKRHPLLATIADATAVLREMSKAGTGIRFGSLSAEGKTAVKSSLERFQFPVNAIHATTLRFDVRQPRLRHTCLPCEITLT